MAKRNKNTTQLNLPQATAPTIDWALFYRKMFPVVIPICTPAGKKRCRQHGKCNSPGKTPLIKGWTKLARVSVAQIKEWFQVTWPEANIAVPTGEVSGLAVLDIDKGKGGFDSARELADEIGSMSSAPRVRTGSGGFHVYYAYPEEGLKNSASVLGSGLDIRGKGGYVVVPPSQHVTGGRYQWDENHSVLDLEPPPFPEKIRRKLASSRKRKRSSEPEVLTGLDDTVIKEGSRNSTLVRICGALVRYGAPIDVTTAVALVANKLWCHPPLSRSEVRSIASRVSEYGPSDILAGTQVVPPPQLHPSALYGVAGQFVKTVVPASEAPAVALLVQLLVMLGNAVGRGPHWLAERDRHYTNEFAVLVGDTSRGRKGTSLGWVREAVGLSDGEWMEKRIQSGLSSGQGLVWEVRDPIPPRNPDKDEGVPGVGDKRLMIIETEFASVLRMSKMDANILSMVLRQAWEGGPLGSMTKHDQTRCAEPHVSLVGHITQRELQAHLNADMIQNGTINRFCWFWVKRSKLLPEGGKVNQDAMNEVMAKIGEAIEFATHLEEMRFTKAASSLWRKMYIELERMEALGMLDAIMARSTAHLRRFAMLYALLDRSKRIDLPHLVAAAALWDYQLDSCRYIFGSSSLSRAEERILTALQLAEDQTLSRSEISRALGGHSKTEEITRYRDSLEMAGLIRWRKERGNSERPNEKWALLDRRSREASRTSSPLHPFLPDEMT